MPRAGSGTWARTTAGWAWWNSKNSPPPGGGLRWGCREQFSNAVHFECRHPISHHPGPHGRGRDDAGAGRSSEQCRSTGLLRRGHVVAGGDPGSASRASARSPISRLTSTSSCWAPPSRRSGTRRGHAAARPVQAGAGPRSRGAPAPVLRRQPRTVGRLAGGETAGGELCL